MAEHQSTIAAAVAALDDPRIRAAVAAADPEDEGSLMRELAARGLSSPAAEALWNPPRRRPRYVQGWRP